jgi:hypothetical protein
MIAVGLIRARFVFAWASGSMKGRSKERIASDPDDDGFADGVLLVAISALCDRSFVCDKGFKHYRTDRGTCR